MTAPPRSSCQPGEAATRRGAEFHSPVIAATEVGLVAGAQRRVHSNDRSTLSNRERELVALRVAGRRRCDYEWAQHVVLGEDAGLSTSGVSPRSGPEAPAAHGTRWSHCFSRRSPADPRAGRPVGDDRRANGPGHRRRVARRGSHHHSRGARQGAHRHAALQTTQTSDISVICKRRACLSVNDTPSGRVHPHEPARPDLSVKARACRSTVHGRPPTSTGSGTAMGTRSLGSHESRDPKQDPYIR
ncbi:carboxymuconolactone decarboxylase family protein [Parafrankia elaeagni]|uniref:carboxymuconolactone decarboxylase family protein n=1 Tax=Parafrankia elaeagni TaxID=222534 RepID=UPI001E4AE898